MARYLLQEPQSILLQRSWNPLDAVVTDLSDGRNADATELRIFLEMNLL